MRPRALCGDHLPCAMVDSSSADKQNNINSDHKIIKLEDLVHATGASPKHQLVLGYQFLAFLVLLLQTTIYIVLSIQFCLQISLILK